MNVRIAGIAILATTMAWAMPSFTRSAHAHGGHDGPARLYLDAVHLESGAEGWVLRAAVNYSDSGQSAPGFLVEATGSGPQGAVFGPLALTDSDADGRYEAGLGPVASGEWSLSLDVSDAPGGDELAIPVTRTWPVTLQPGQAVEIIGRQSTSGDGGSSGAFAIPLLLGAAVVAMLGVTARRLSRYPKRRASSAA